jgi:hypothetical protein
MNGYMLYTRWPSIQRDSEILARRIAPELRLRMARQALAPFLRRYEKRAA